MLTLILFLQLQYSNLAYFFLIYQNNKLNNTTTIFINKLIIPMLKNRYSQQKQKTKISIQSNLTKQKYLLNNLQSNSELNNSMLKNTFNKRIIVKKMKRNVDEINKTSFQHHKSYGLQHMTSKERQKRKSLNQNQREKFIQRLNFSVFHDKPPVNKIQLSKVKNQQAVQKKIEANVSMLKSRTHRSKLLQSSILNQNTKKSGNSSKLHTKTQQMECSTKTKPNLLKYKSKTTRYHNPYKQQSLMLMTKLQKAISNTFRNNTAQLYQKLQNNLNQLQQFQKISLCQSRKIDNISQNNNFIHSYRQKLEQSSSQIKNGSSVIKSEQINEQQSITNRQSIIKQQGNIQQQDNKKQDGGKHILIEPRQYSDDSSQKQRDDQYYQNKLQRLANDYLNDCQKMKYNKNHIFANFRTKLATAYPQMRKHYTQYKLPYKQQHEDNPSVKKNDKNKNILNKTYQNKMTNQIRSSSLSNYLKSSHTSMSNYPTHNINKKSKEQFFQSYSQNKLLKMIFKQAYFWSKTRNKPLMMSKAEVVCKVQQTQQRQQDKHLANIQKKLSFIKYMKSKDNRCKILGNKNKIRTSKIRKNQQNILSLQKQGSKQRFYLQKYLHQVIQSTMDDI